MSNQKLGHFTAPPHPKPWELDVQTGIRELRPPLPPGTVAMLGFDAAGLAAVTMWSSIDDPGEYLFQMAAIATRVRGQQGGSPHAHEAIDVALSIMIAEAVQSSARELGVVGRVHHQNRASQRLLSAHGFVRSDAPNQKLQDHYDWILAQGL